MDSTHSKTLSLYSTCTRTLTCTQSSILVLDSYSKLYPRTQLVLEKSGLDPPLAVCLQWTLGKIEHDPPALSSPIQLENQYCQVVSVRNQVDLLQGLLLFHDDSCLTCSLRVSFLHFLLSPSGNADLTLTWVLHCIEHGPACCCLSICS